jgi:hypothetical protein
MAHMTGLDVAERHFSRAKELVQEQMQRLKQLDREVFITTSPNSFQEPSWHRSASMWLRGIGSDANSGLPSARLVHSQFGL